MAECSAKENTDYKHKSGPCVNDVGSSITILDEWWCVKVSIDICCNFQNLSDWQARSTLFVWVDLMVHMSTYICTPIYPSGASSPFYQVKVASIIARIMYELRVGGCNSSTPSTRKIRFPPKVTRLLSRYPARDDCLKGEKGWLGSLLPRQIGDQL